MRMRVQAIAIAATHDATTITAMRVEPWRPEEEDEEEAALEEEGVGRGGRESV